MANLSAVQAYADFQMIGPVLDKIDVETPAGDAVLTAFQRSAEALETAPIQSNADAAAKLRYALGSGFDLTFGDSRKMLEDIAAFLERSAAQ